MRFLSRNVAGLNNLARQHQVLRQCRDYDVAFLQETKLRRTRIPFIKAKWGNDHVYHSTTDGPSRGVLTLISSRCSPTVIHEATDQNGQYHIILVNIRDSNYLLVNFYGNPDTDAAAYNTMTALRDTLEGIQQRFTIDKGRGVAEQAGSVPGTQQHQYQKRTEVNRYLSEREIEY